MRVKDTKGRYHTFSLSKYSKMKQKDHSKSSYHLRARNMLLELYPMYDAYEEVGMPGENLYLDFYIPRLKLAIEVHGEQHYKFIKHFHVDMQGFVEACRRDQRKAEWCEINNIKLIVLPYNGETDEWRESIVNA